MAEHCVEPIPACWRPLLKELQRESDAVQPRREAAYAVLRAAGVVGLLGDTDTHRIVRVPAHADLRQCRNCGRPFYALSDEPRARRRWGYCQRGCTWHERRRLAHRRGEPPIVRPPLRPWPKRTCLHCGDEFVPARRDARYCSGRCRVAQHRANRRTASPR